MCTFTLLHESNFCCTGANTYRYQMYFQSGFLPVNACLKLKLSVPKMEIIQSETSVFKAYNACAMKRHAPASAIQGHYTVSQSSQSTYMPKSTHLPLAAWATLSSSSQVTSWGWLQSWHQELKCSQNSWHKNLNQNTALLQKACKR